MKMKGILAVASLVTLISTGAHAFSTGENSPVVSPTFPGKISAGSVRFVTPSEGDTPWKYKFNSTDTIPMPENMKYSKKTAGIDDIDSSLSTQAVFKGLDGKILYFTQFRNVDGSFSVVIPKKFYIEMATEGYSFEGQDVKVVSDEEYHQLIKDVQLVVYVKETGVRNKYLGGEGGRCAAGTIGGAISGGIAGASVGGPVGAAIGAVGGGLVGSAASCR